MKLTANCSHYTLAAVALAASISVAHADTWDKKTIVSFSQQVEVPGAILQPGKYVMKLVDSQSDRHIVQFMNERQNHVYASAIAIPAYRTQVTGRTVIDFYEAAAGQAEPIHYWYYPGDNFGQEFVYPKEHIREIAAVHSTTSEFEAQRPAEPTPVTAAEAVPEASAATTAAATETQPQDSLVPNEESNAPVEIAQATPPKSDEQFAAPQQTAPEPVELPHTSGNFAGIAMMGLISLGSAIAARKFRRF